MIAGSAHAAHALRLDGTTVSAAAPGLHNRHLRLRAPQAFGSRWTTQERDANPRQPKIQYATSFVLDNAIQITDN
jgi:hypothetical protein